MLTAERITATYPRADRLPSTEAACAAGHAAIEMIDRALAAYGLRARLWWAPDGPDTCTLTAEVTPA